MVYQTMLTMSTGKKERTLCALSFLCFIFKASNDYKNSDRRILNHF